jgi:hypothetical protein
MGQWEKVGNIMGPQGPAGAPGTGGSNAIFNEIPVMTADLSHAVFQTANAYQPNTLMVYLNGLRQRKPADYSETTSTTFTMATPPSSADTLLIDYML